MVPDSYVDYFTATVTAAAALIGLLFVAVALRPDSVFGAKAPASGRVLAGSAFTGLSNAFFLSLMALVPNVKLGLVAIVLGLLGVYNTGRTHFTVPSGERSWWVIIASLIAYVVEVVEGVVLAIHEHDSSAVNSLAYVVVASFAVALARAWLLMQGKHLQGDAS